MNYPSTIALTTLLSGVMLAVMVGCDPPCIFEGVCDDGNPCTVDTCMHDGKFAECINEPVDCGDQSCDPASGECVDCIDDAACDDGNFCNGVETCADNACVDGVNPCADGQSCDEVNDGCVDGV